MKKLLSIPLVLTLVLTASTSVFAADINQNSNQNADTTVTFKVDPAYTVTVSYTHLDVYKRQLYGRYRG